MSAPAYSTLPAYHPLAMRMIKALHPSVGVIALRAFNLHLRRKSSYVVKTNRGFAIACSPRQLIQVCIMQFGHWEPNISAVIEHLVRERSCVVDIGANVGYVTLLMSQKVGPAGRVLAFEAYAPTFATLQSNLALNRTSNVRARCLAITDAAGEIEIFGGTEHNNGNASLVPSGSRTAALRVEALPLHSALSTEDVATAEFIKIDVEGAELGIMANLVANLGRYTQLRSILVECSSADDEAGWRNVWNGLLAQGFSAYAVDNDYSYASYLKWRSPARPKKIDALPREQTDVLFTKVDLRW